MDIAHAIRRLEVSIASPWMTSTTPVAFLTDQSSLFADEIAAGDAPTSRTPERS